MLMFGHGIHKIPFSKSEVFGHRRNVMAKRRWFSFPSPGTSLLRNTLRSNGNTVENLLRNKNLLFFPLSKYNAPNCILRKMRMVFFLLIDRHQYDAKTNPVRGCLNLCNDLGHFSFPLILSILLVAYHVKSIWCSRSFCIHNRT